MARKSAKQVGALWRHEHEKVGTFLTGTLDLGGLGEVPIAVFKNDRKEAGTKQPDFRIVLSPRNGNGNNGNGAAGAERDPFGAEEEALGGGGQAQPPAQTDDLPY
ncbi:hypothetical protein HYR69_00590 [Candidatus Sumerlaeota bacterium]|nr:hypothetical protein [Candidatus Sumerlaeota bacterium]